MNHAERCPVCNGFGHIALPPPDIEGTGGGVGPTQACHGCNGRGWITVSDVVSLGGRGYPNPPQPSTKGR